MLQGGPLASVNVESCEREQVGFWRGWVGFGEAGARTKGRAVDAKRGKKRLEEQNGGQRSPSGLSELRSVYSSGWQNQLCTHLHDSNECRQTHRRFPSSLPVEPAFACAAPYPLCLAVITVSLRSRHPPGGMNLLINLVLIVCAEEPIMSWFVYILAH